RGAADPASPGTVATCRTDRRRRPRRRTVRAYRRCRAAGRRPVTARRVRDPGQALLIAEHLPPALAAGAAEGDRDRRLPDVELAQLSASGLLAITVPEEFGGLGADTPTLVEVVRTLAAGDPNLAQIPHSHYVYLNVLRRHGSP